MSGCEAVNLKENSALGGDRNVVEAMTRITMAHIRNLLHREGLFTVHDMTSDLVIAQPGSYRKQLVCHVCL